MEIVFFTSPAEWRAWLDENYATAKELEVGFYKKATQKPTITYQEALDEALAHGWIDGVRNSIDEESYRIRYTPRTPRSIWSQVNIKRVAELTEAGRMHASGLKTFEERDPKQQNKYSFEQSEGAYELGEAYEQQFRANEKAWDFFQAQAATYRKSALWWVKSAKQEATRDKRLAQLIEESAAGQRLKQFVSPSKRK